MNWAAMGLMAVILGGCMAVAGISTWLIERLGVSPGWILAGYFALAILAVGVLAP